MSTLIDTAVLPGRSLLRVLTDAPSTKRVLLVDMPFRPIDTSPLAIGTLAAALREAGIATDVSYVSTQFARRVGANVYDYLSHLGYFGGTAEILFAPHHDKLAVDAVSQEEILLLLSSIWQPAIARRVLGSEWTSTSFVDLCSRICADVVPSLLEDVMDRVMWDSYDVVGFSLASDQTLPSIALASIIKSRYPDKILVCGGPACHGEKGIDILRTFPCVDIASLGEADAVFAPLVTKIRGGGLPAAIPGIAYRSRGDITRTSPPRAVEDLDKLPIPQYDDYFELARDLGVHPTLTFETSRAATTPGMHRRKKTTARLVDEIDALAAKYQCTYFAAADDTLDASLFRPVFPALRERCAARRQTLSFELPIADKDAASIEQMQFIEAAAEAGIQVHFGAGPFRSTRRA